jgi:hypothetical protein
VSQADANECRERARASRLAFLGNLLSVLAVPSTRPGILDGLCRLHAMEKCRYETGMVLRTILGVHSRLPASERKTERRATLASPAAQMVETVARLFVDAGGRGAGAMDNIDLEHSTAILSRHSRRGNPSSFAAVDQSPPTRPWARGSGGADPATRLQLTSMTSIAAWLFAVPPRTRAHHTP